MSAAKKDDSYYPLRWRLADFVENIIILHRTRAALAVAGLGALMIFVGLLIFGWRPFSGDDEAIANPRAELTETTVDDSGVAEAQFGRGTAVRPIATPEDVQQTTSGSVIELGPTVMRLTGGFSSDAAADLALSQAVELFPNRELLDAQVLSDQFRDTDQVVIRVIEPNFFLEGSSELNPDLVGLIADVATTIQSRDGWTVEVAGHGASEALSSERAQAAADQLVANGIALDTVTVSGRGNSEAIPGTLGHIDFLLN